VIRERDASLVAALRSMWDQDLVAGFANLQQEVMYIWDKVDVGSELPVNLEYMLYDVEATMECYANEIRARGLK